MATYTEAETPDFVAAGGVNPRIALRGAWSLDAERRLEKKASDIVKSVGAAKRVVFDVGAVSRLDTAGAFALNRARSELAAAGAEVAIEGARPEHQILLDRMRYREAPAPPKRENFILALLADLGEQITGGFRDAYQLLAYLGEFVSVLIRVAVRPKLFRGTSLVYQMENFAVRSIPIIVIMNLTVGAIVAQQGIYELLRFGASVYVVDLVGILVLREMGVLLTAIMIAGRCGSAITAEIGSMKVREEVDALRAMGMSPMEVLSVPRALALALSMPLLTFLADMAAILGGMLTSWAYEGISPAAFIALLQAAISIRTFLVGMIKAPVMGMVIGLIATQEGLATQGSAESLGWRVTASVVKSIFTVIILDGLFAVFFTAINF